MTTVPTRPIGDSGIDASVLSLGSWHTYDRMDFADAVTLIRRAVDAGITLFDVGVYAAPGMPPVFTDVLFSAMVRAAGIKRNEFLLSSKLWLSGFGDDGFRPQLDNALMRAGCDFADLVILGDRVDGDFTLRDIVLDLDALKRDGLIRTWGVNNWSATDIRELRRIAADEGVEPPQMAQLKYSVARRSIPDGEPFAALFEEGFTMQASDCLEGGILAGNVDTDRQVGRDPGQIREKIIASVPEIVSVAEKLGTTPAQLCLAFTLTHPHNTSTLFGASRLEQLESNLASLELLETVGADEIRSLLTPFWADKDVVDPEGP